ncbi:hypothetical protein POVCU2_0092410 [Plasmodium ovale curtisi]|uniref:PIR Superfamily Protein n=1 Tax=Plasmodium ovale curtisi TaxID=864141 RepID=A0A1A8WQ45_PLAOA|nr:hypothetical protein POVCU2_0092410 [Plasmodium ovale curtisi]
MLKDIFTQIFALLNGIKTAIRNFIFISSEKGDRVFIEDGGEDKTRNVENRQEVVREKEATQEDNDEEEDDEEEEEDEEEEDDDEDDDDEDDDDEDDEDEENEEDEDVVDCDGNKIPPELVSCHSHTLKLNLCKKNDIKLICDYLENFSDATNKSAIENEINNSNYCESINKIIDLYNDETKCEDSNSDKEYCQEVKQLREKYTYRNLHNFTCTVGKSPSCSQEAPIQSMQIPVKGSEVTPPGKENTIHSTTGSLSGNLSFSETKNIKGSPNQELAAPGLPNSDGMREEQTLWGGEQTDESDQVHSETLTLGNMNGSITMESTSTTFCPQGTNKEPCQNSLQESEEIGKEDTNKLGQSNEEHTVNQEEEHVDLQHGSGSTSTAITSVSSVLGIPLLLFMLYKFIPIGSLSNNLREKISTWNINAAQYDQHLLYNPVLGNTNSNNNRYNIGYYSLIDS